MELADHPPQFQDPAAAVSPRTVNFTIVSDVVCAWCYIGMARLHHALEGIGDIKAAITWRPFELNPEMPDEGVDRVAYFDAKFGPNKRGAIEARVLDAASHAGLHLDWSRIKRMPNTRKAHVLIRYAAQHNAADAIHDALMRAHFAEGRDIGSTPTLLDIADERGLPRSEVARSLCDPTQASLVEMDLYKSVRAGVRGVPFFILADRAAFSGAIESNEWRRILAGSLSSTAADGC